MIMKRLYTIIAILLLGTLARAQEGLFVEDLFEGRAIPYTLMKRTFISGSQLHPYKLEVMVLRDAYDAPDKQTDYDGDHLTYALVCLPPMSGGRNRYLCYQAKEIKGMWDVTVVYLRGPATMEDLNKMFNKKEK